jgi:hypothetical protein
MFNTTRVQRSSKVRNENRSYTLSPVEYRWLIFLLKLGRR